jgi:hypothetical protein
MQPTTGKHPKRGYLLLGLLLLGGPACGADETEDAPVEPNIKLLEPLDKPRGIIGQGVTDFADWLDGFFGENRIYQETQNSYLKLHFIHTITEGESPLYDAKLNGKIDLPRLEKNFKLLFESEQEDGIDGGESTPLKSLEAQRQSLALQYITEPFRNWQLSTDSGLRLSSNPDIFVRMRAYRAFALDTWTLRASQSLFWFESLGEGATTQVDLERRIDSRNFFRSTTAATWLDDNHYYDLVQEFSLFHIYNPRVTFLYQASAHGITEPTTHVTDYVLSVRLRRQIHRDWLYFEINPRITYPEEEDFGAVKSLSLRLEMIFRGH